MPSWGPNRTPTRGNSYILIPKLNELYDIQFIHSRAPNSPSETGSYPHLRASAQPEVPHINHSQTCPISPQAVTATAQGVPWVFSAPHGVQMMEAPDHARPGPTPLVHQLNPGGLPQHTPRCSTSACCPRRCAQRPARACVSSWAARKAPASPRTKLDACCFSCSAAPAAPAGQLGHHPHSHCPN